MSDLAELLADKIIDLKMPQEFNTGEGLSISCGILLGYYEKDVVLKKYNELASEEKAKGIKIDKISVLNNILSPSI